MHSLEFPRELVSVIMPAFNAEAYIGQAIESVLSQTYSDWELIIVNDGSMDRTPEIVSRYADSRIKVFHQENGGESSARNTALKHARGKWVAFLDADDLYLPNHLKEAIKYLQSHTEHQGVYTNGYYIDQDGLKLKPLSSRRRGPFDGDIFEQMVRSSDVFGAPVCVVLCRDLIDQNDLDFDPEVIIGPDWDFLTRYSAVARFGYVDQSTCLYRVHLDNISLRTDARTRMLSLARCREKAIKMERFAGCSLETRYFVFYDLLVNLLASWPERQSLVVGWQEFHELPEQDRARLLRLIAGKAISSGGDVENIRRWLNLSNILNPYDLRGVLLVNIYLRSPWLCNFMLKIKAVLKKGAGNNLPFEDFLK